VSAIQSVNKILLSDREWSGDRELITEQYAHLWGVKAARTGMPRTSNPYLNSRWRSAWEAGYSAALVAEGGLCREWAAREGG
jgi:hypothetical protein